MNFKFTLLCIAVLFTACNNTTTENKGSTLSVSQKIQLPPETKTARTYTRILEDTGDVICISLLAGESGDLPLLVLRSDNDTLVFTTFSTDANEEGTYISRIQRGEIPMGSYRLGVCSIDRGQRTLHFTDNYLYNFIPTSLSIPGEISDIAYFFELIADSADKIFLNGWAFVKNQDAEKARISIVLKSADETLAFPVQPVERQGMTAYFSSPVNIDNSGFKTVVAKKQLRSDIYKLGIMIENGAKRSYVQTDNFVSVVRKISFDAPVAGTENIKAGVDVAKVEGNKIVVSGWAFLKDKNADNTVVYVVFQGPGKTYRFIALPVKRKDITKTFGQGKINLDDSGFELKLDRSMLDTTGTFHLGLFLENKNSLEQGFTSGHGVITID